MIIIYLYIYAYYIWDGLKPPASYEEVEHHLGFFFVPRCLANHGIATQTDDGQGVMEKLWLV